jgi:glycosyltransferase involved in cell wall biosynthesis
MDQHAIMKQKPRILIIENSTAITGALKSIMRSCDGLRDQFYFVFILPRHSKARTFVEAGGFFVHELPMIELRKNPVSLLLYVPYLLYNTFRLFYLLGRLKIDLINVNDFYNLLPAVYKFLGGKVPYVCYVRFLPSKFPVRLVKFWCSAHRRALSMIAVSEAVKRELPYAGKVEVIANELPAEEKPYEPPVSTTILYPANYTRGKGQEYALQSFAAISKKYPHWKLRFVGGDMGLQKNADFKKELIELSVKLGIEKQVDWQGFANYIFKEYQQASIVLNFSESESFSLTCLEAMFYGRALIATKSGGPSEIVDDGTTGLLVPVADTPAMTQALELLITNKELRETLARRAYSAAREKYGFANTTCKLGELYARVV